MKKTRLFGQITFPESGNKVTGVWLNIEKDSIFLETPHNSLKHESWFIIHGEFNGLDKVTFVGCYAGSGSSGTGGTWRKVRVSYLIKDIHLNSYDNLYFNKIEISSPALNNWMNEPEMIEKIEPNNFLIPKNNTLLRFDVNNNISISITTCYDYELNPKSFNAKRNCIVEITSKSELHLDHFSLMMSQLKKLILFVTNKNPEFSTYYITNSNNNSFELINTPHNLNEDKFTQNIRLGYNMMKLQLPLLFKNWMSDDDLIVIIDLLLEKCYNPDMSFQGYFLNMCVAIESFHGKYTPKRTYECIEENKKKRKIISTLISDIELKKWFNEKSNYWKNPSLKERLTDYSETIEAIKGDTFIYDTPSLITKIIKTRNDIAHKGEYENHFERIELFLIGKVLEYTIRLEILKQLGINFEKPIDLVTDANRQVQILARLNNYKKINP